MKDPTVEQWLDELHVPWAYVEMVDLNKIDQKASLRNQARLEPINEETVDRYVEAMKAGDRFPAIILRKVGERLVVLGGNHRQTAARRAKAILAAYIVDCVDETALRISYEDNRDHGLPPAEAERVLHGLHLHACGWDVTKAARVVGVSNNKLSRAIAAAEYGRRCERLGHSTWRLAGQAMAETSKSRLMNLRSDPAFLDAVHLVEDAELGTDDVYRIVTDLNATRSEAEALELIRNERVLASDRIQKKAAGAAVNSSKLPIRAQLVRSLIGVRQMIPDDVARSTLPDQRAELRKQLRAAMEHLVAIDDAVKAAR